MIVYVDKARINLHAGKSRKNNLSFCCAYCTFPLCTKHWNKFDSHLIHVPITSISCSVPCLKIGQCTNSVLIKSPFRHNFGINKSCLLNPLHVTVHCLLTAVLYNYTTVGTCSLTLPLVKFVYKRTLTGYSHVDRLLLQNRWRVARPIRMQRL